MGYGSALTSGLLKAASLGYAGYSEGRQEGKALRQKAIADAAKLARENALAESTLAVNRRTASLADPNSPEALAAKSAASIREHQANRTFDVNNPTRDADAGSRTDSRALRMARSAYIAKLMAPSHDSDGMPHPGMSPQDADDMATAAYGPADGRSGDRPSSTASTMGRSILRGGGMATSTAPKKTGTGTNASSTQPGRVGNVNVPPPRTTPTSASAGSRGAMPALGTTGRPIVGQPARVVSGREQAMSPADLWEKKVHEGMNEAEATAYVKRIKG